MSWLFITLAAVYVLSVAWCLAAMSVAKRADEMREALYKRELIQRMRMVERPGNASDFALWERELTQ